jgi:hypothetical protein
MHAPMLAKLDDHRKILGHDVTRSAALRALAVEALAQKRDRK